jgi:hypothetical protein
LLQVEGCVRAQPQNPLTCPAYLRIKTMPEL